MHLSRNLAVFRPSPDQPCLKNFGGISRYYVACGRLRRVESEGGDRDSASGRSRGPISPLLQAAGRDLGPAWPRRPEEFRVAVPVRLVIDSEAIRSIEGTSGPSGPHPPRRPKGGGSWGPDIRASRPRQYAGSSRIAPRNRRARPEGSRCPSSQDAHGAQAGAEEFGEPDLAQAERPRMARISSGDGVGISAGTRAVRTRRHSLQRDPGSTASQIA